MNLKDSIKNHVTSARWIECDDRFSPDLPENSKRFVETTDGGIRLAQFCFGEGEYWWIDTGTGKELAVKKYRSTQINREKKR